MAACSSKIIRSIADRVEFFPNLTFTHSTSSNNNNNNNNNNEEVNSNYGRSTVSEYMFFLNQSCYLFCQIPYACCLQCYVLMAYHYSLPSSLTLLRNGFSIPHEY
jgi:hypothetical protein